MANKINLSTRILEELPVPKAVKRKDHDPCFFFGGVGQFKKHDYAGMAQKENSNILILGGTGSGKSSGIVQPTLQTWTGPIFALDIKGELTKCYRKYAKSCPSDKEIRPYIVFDPSTEDSIRYDPFEWLAKDDDNNLVTNTFDLASALIPITPDIKDPFWVESERAILAAALLFHYQMGMTFSGTIIRILTKSVKSLCEDMENNGRIEVKMMIAGTKDLKEETIACIDRGLRNHLLLFGTDQMISNAFSGKEEGGRCFDWDDLTDKNLFLKIPADKLDVWGPAIRLMLIQLIRYLERRPEKHSHAGKKIKPTLLMLDEFAQFGKVECLVNAATTLRSKAVTICFVVQSLAQLDAVYGKEQRRIILDNCPWKAILQAGDPETQRAIADMVGTTMVSLRNKSRRYNFAGTLIGESVSTVKSRDYIIQPNGLQTMEDVLLLSPYGICSLHKNQEHTLLKDIQYDVCFNRYS